MGDKDDMKGELTPEQILGTIIISAFKGGYSHSACRWEWELYGQRVNFDALQDAFDAYIAAKVKPDGPDK